jgi:hypothetical protein
MNRKLAAIITLQTLIIIFLFWMLVIYGKDEYETYVHRGDAEIESKSHVATVNGAAVVTLSVVSQQQSGIISSPLSASSHQTTLSTYGTVLGIDPLIELRTRYLAARADANVIRASISNSQQEYQRLLLLNRDNRNVSDRAVAAAEAALKSDEARVVAAETTANSLRDSMRQQWGETLAAWATGAGNGSLQGLMQYREVLILVTLPFDAPSPGKGSNLLVEPTGTGGKPVNASFIAPAPQTDPTIQGKTFYYRASAENLRVGMRVSVHLAAHDKAAQGVIVPSSAVIWYADKAWVYKKQGEESFIRSQINADSEAGDGWFAAGSLKAGDEVVTSGAQLLLSEEFKDQIKNENGD